MCSQNDCSYVQTGNCSVKWGPAKVEDIFWCALVSTVYTLCRRQKETHNAATAVIATKKSTQRGKSQLVRKYGQQANMSISKNMQHYKVLRLPTAWIHMMNPRTNIPTPSAKGIIPNAESIVNITSVEKSQVLNPRASETSTTFMFGSRTSSGTHLKDLMTCQFLRRIAASLTVFPSTRAYILWMQLH